MKKILIAVGIIILDWLLYFLSSIIGYFDIDFLIIFLTTIFTVIYFINAKISKLFLFAVPLFLICLLISIFNTISYMKGNASLDAMGYMGRGLPRYNVEYRMYLHQGSCIRSAPIDIPDLYGNFYLKSLVKIFGYQKGAFTGYFPTKEEIKTFIKNTKFKESNFDLEEKEKGISFINIHNINQKFEIPYFRHECLWNDEVKVLYEKYNEDILFIRIKDPGRSHFFCNNIFLDIKGGKYITSYYNTELSIEE
jgi:energy-coupling factor transporter transmembrane protein EcfT